MSEYDPTYKIGEKVRAVDSYAHRLVAGEHYTVVDNTAPVQVDTFRLLNTPPWKTPRVCAASGIPGGSSESEPCP